MVPTPDQVLIFDTTLRDGEQSPGASMNLAEKLEVARALAELGVDVIEAGFPIASPGDFEAVQAIAREVHGPIICGLARCNADDIDRAWALAATRRGRASTSSWPPAPSTASSSSRWPRTRSSAGPSRASARARELSRRRRVLARGRRPHRARLPRRGRRGGHRGRRHHRQHPRHRRLRRAEPVRRRHSAT